MTTKEIIDLMKEKETAFLKTKSFSKLPGIYAFFFIGNDFPMLGDLVSKHQIIYIGKTESSQEKRDAKTHFTTGKTGSSTVRKSIGSLLCEQENLTPIPRNSIDYEAGRHSHFKFDGRSEQIITNWMENNLALAFYEYPKSKELIDALETDIIRQLKPILNIDHKNPNNPHKDQIRQLRKNCAAIAINNSDFKTPTTERKKSNPVIVQHSPLHSSDSGVVLIDNITTHQTLELF